MSPDPMSARKMSLFGATISHRGFLKPFANTLILNPAGTVGRNPAGGATLLGALADDFVAYGAGNDGFFPCVNCAHNSPGTAMAANARTAISIRQDIVVPFSEFLDC